MMLIIKAENIKKEYSDREILNIKKLEVYNTDRIGIVGMNGCGKTTLLKTLCGEIKPDSGNIKTFGRVSYIPQLEMGELDPASPSLLGKFNVLEINPHTMSGGEKTRLKIASALSCGSHVIMADEPTSNLDKNGIELVKKQLKYYKGALLLISHDRELLDSLCDKIWELKDSSINEYLGNYTSYIDQKEAEIIRQEFEYQDYTKERARLETAMEEKKKRASEMMKKPKNMSNNEYNSKPLVTSTKSPESRQKSVNRTAKAIESRIEQLDIKERPIEARGIDFKIPDNLKLNSKYAVIGNNISKSFDEKLIFQDADFQIKTGIKTAITGNNGIGKTTLLKMIVNCEEGISLSQRASIGYFDQSLSQLDTYKSVLENVMENSIYNPAQTRAVLAQMLFRSNELNKKVGLLSGGERIRVLLCKLLVSTFNLLILDEPTNYLDIKSIEALEKALGSYPGTVIFISHDERFVENVADEIFHIEDYKIYQIK